MKYRYIFFTQPSFMKGNKKKEILPHLPNFSVNLKPSFVCIQSQIFIAWFHFVTEHSVFPFRAIPIDYSGGAEQWEKSPHTIQATFKSFSQPKSLKHWVPYKIMTYFSLTLVLKGHCSSSLTKTNNQVITLYGQ